MLRNPLFDTSASLHDRTQSIQPYHRGQCDTIIVRLYKTIPGTRKSICYKCTSWTK